MSDAVRIFAVIEGRGEGVTSLLLRWDCSLC